MVSQFKVLTIFFSNLQKYRLARQRYQWLVAIIAEVTNRPKNVETYGDQ